MLLLSISQKLLEFYYNNFFLESEHTIWDVVFWGAAFLLFGYYLVLPLLREKKAKIDERFLLGLASYVILGGFARVLGQGDLGLFSFSGQRFWEIGFWLDSPGIWVFSILYATMLLAFFLKARKGMLAKHDPIKLWSLAGLTSMLLVLATAVYYGLKLEGIYWLGLLNIAVILSIAFSITFCAAKIFKAFKSKLFKPLTHKLAFLAQMLDATGTFIAIQFYGYGEQHVIPRLLMEYFGPASFYLLKIPVTILALYYIDREVKDRNIKNSLIAFIMIFGLGPGSRTLLRLLFGV